MDGRRSRPRVHPRAGGNRLDGDQIGHTDDEAGGSEPGQAERDSKQKCADDCRTRMPRSESDTHEHPNCSPEDCNVLQELAANRNMLHLASAEYGCPASAHRKSNRRRSCEWHIILRIISRVSHLLDFPRQSSDDLTSRRFRTLTATTPRPPRGFSSCRSTSTPARSAGGPCSPLRTSPAARSNASAARPCSSPPPRYRPAGPHRPKA